jgi:hypothetical protein
MDCVGGYEMGAEAMLDVRLAKKMKIGSVDWLQGCGMRLVYSCCDSPYWNGFGTCGSYGVCF